MLSVELLLNVLCITTVWLAVVLQLLRVCIVLLCCVLLLMDVMLSRSCSCAASTILLCYVALLLLLLCSIRVCTVAIAAAAMSCIAPAITSFSSSGSSSIDSSRVIHVAYVSSWEWPGVLLLLLLGMVVRAIAPCRGMSAAAAAGPAACAVL